jgi:hypothetical protein
MTEQFFTALKERLAELVGGLRYLHKPTGAMVAPQIIDLMLPRSTEPLDEGEEYPFVRWIVYRGTFIRQGLVAFSVAVDAGIYAEDIAEGNAGISELCLHLGRIVQVPAFSSYLIDGPVTFVVGSPDPEERNPGMQGHPYYHCRMFINFSIPGLS